MILSSLFLVRMTIINMPKRNEILVKFYVGKKFFLPIINLLKIKDIPTVQIKLLYLLKKWGIKFENQKTIIPNFSDVYSRLKNNGVEFPEYKDTDYNKYFINSNDNNEQKNLEENPNDTFYYLKYLRDILKEQNFQHKYTHYPI